MFKKLNKKGVSFPIIWGGVFLCMVVASVILTPSHRKRQAIQMCQEQGGLDCEDMVEEMTPEQILDYIKDE